MSDPGARFAHAIAAVDAANADDPQVVEVQGQRLPAALVHGQRMSATLARLDRDPSECLRVAARGQHIERWKVPRRTYPAGRAGYLDWRRHQRRFQTERLGEIMAAAGYGADDIAQVGGLIRKERLGRDGEAQTLEDVIYVVFFEHYLKGFVARVEEDKLADILARAWRRMSEHGQRHVRRLALPPNVPRLLERGLARMPPGHPVSVG